MSHTKEHILIDVLVLCILNNESCSMKLTSEQYAALNRLLMHVTFVVDIIIFSEKDIMQTCHFYKILMT